MTIRYTARFTPEKWVRDNAVEVDPQGPQEWDCTEFAAGHAGYLAAIAARFGDTVESGVVDAEDRFKDDPAAPEWVRGWRGPFTISVWAVSEQGEQR